jgi:hypothetical protein
MLHTEFDQEPLGKRDAKPACPRQTSLMPVCMGLLKWFNLNGLAAFPELSLQPEEPIYGMSLHRTEKNASHSAGLEPKTKKSDRPEKWRWTASPADQSKHNNLARSTRWYRPRPPAPRNHSKD